MVDMLIVPTAGFDGKGGPSEAGQRRILKAITALCADEAKTIAILGGARREGLSEAEVYRNYLKENFQQEAESISFVDASACCSNRDMEVFRDRFSTSSGEPVMKKSEIRIGVTSYPKHMKRIAIVLRWLGFRHIEFFDSGEPQAYPDWAERVMTLITFLDPGWHWLGLPLVRMANRRISGRYD